MIELTNEQRIAYRLGQYKSLLQEIQANIERCRYDVRPAADVYDDTDTIVWSAINAIDDAVEVALDWD